MKFYVLNRTVKGTATPHVSNEVFKNIPIPILSLHEQKGIIKVLSTIDRVIGVETRRREKLERLKRGLMELLLTEKVRVVVDDSSA